MTIVESAGPEETFRAGYQMARKAERGDVIALTGDLGVGKTVFTKGFAKGLGIQEDVSSPTFTILQIYEGGRLPLYHFDVYRIGDPEEMSEVGWEEYIFGDGVSLIEWSDLISGLIEEIPDSRLTHVEISKDPERGFDYRRITISGPDRTAGREQVKDRR